MTDESKDSLILAVGGAIAGFLVKVAGGWMQRNRKDPVTLSAQNIAWAQDIMTRMENEIRELRERVTELEIMIEAERASRFACEEKYKELLARMHTLTQKIERNK